MKRYSPKASAGFTIVELLIVIVIIAILATMLFFTYNGIQAKTRSTQTAQAVDQYRKALIAYAAQNGRYPIDDYQACIGTGYPNLGGDSRGDCRVQSGGTISTDNWFNQQIKGYLPGSVPRPQARVDSPGNIMVGAYFDATDTQEDPILLDGKGVYNWLVYVVEGYHANCPVGPTYGPDYSKSPAQGGSEDWWDFKSTRTEKYSFSEANGVQCWLPLPNIKDI